MLDGFQKVYPSRQRHETWRWAVVTARVRATVCRGVYHRPAHPLDRAIGGQDGDLRHSQFHQNPRQRIQCRRLQSNQPYRFLLVAAAVFYFFFV